MLATGVYWHSADAVLALAYPDGREVEHPVRPGDQIGWRLRGPRTCIGVWNAAAHTRRPCPWQAEVDSGRVTAQCSACAGDNRGRALARDAVADDDRAWAVYLAWYGPGLVKVGITATDRGADRLAEQGALAFSWLGQATLPTARRTERLIAATGLATERIAGKTKLAAWWQLPDVAERERQLLAVHEQLTGSLPTELKPTPPQIHHLTRAYGLDQPPTRPRQQITRFLAERADSADSVLSGRLVCMAGRTAIIDAGPPVGAVLVDLRLMDGWHLTTAPTSLRGIDLADLAVPGLATSPGRTHGHSNTGDTVDTGDTLF